MDYRIKWTKVWIVNISKKFTSDFEKFKKSIKNFEENYWIKIDLWDNFFLWFEWVSPQNRVKDFNKFVIDKDVKLIFCYSWWWFTNEILPYIDYENFKKNNKFVMWFCDSDLLCNSLLKKTWKINFCSTVFNYLKDDQRYMSTCKKYFDQIFVNWEKKIYLENIKKYKYFDKLDIDEVDDWWIKILKYWKTNWKIIWVNLICFNLLFWTKFCPNLSKKILFLEESDQYSLELVRKYFTQISMIKWFNELNWIIFWKITSKNINENLNIQKTILDIFWKLNIPIIINVWYWHILPRQVIPIWSMCYIDTYKQEYYFEI